MDGIVIYRAGVIHLSVCAPKDTPIEDILAEADKQHPTGLGHGWQISPAETFSGGEPNPCPCNSEPETREHRLLNC